MSRVTSPRVLKIEPSPSTLIFRTREFGERLTKPAGLKAFDSKASAARLSVISPKTMANTHDDGVLTSKEFSPKRLLSADGFRDSVKGYDPPQTLPKHISIPNVASLCSKLKRESFFFEEAKKRKDLPGPPTYSNT